MGTEAVLAGAGATLPHGVGHHRHHAVLFPFMSKGHTIPILHLAHLLLRRQISLTVFTTPANRAFIAAALPAADVSIVELPFPADIPGIPAGVESTDKLPSVNSLFPQFALATDRIRPDFESALAKLRPRPDFMVSDGFLWWTQDSAEKFGIPRLVFYGMSNHALSVSGAVAADRVLLGPEPEDELLAVPQFPWIKVCKSDFEDWARLPDPKGDPHFDFVIKSVAACSRSFGYVMNSFIEFEPVFVDHLNRLGSQRYYCVGPLCLSDVDDGKQLALAAKPEPKPAWIRWLDEKLAQGRSVLYVAFGSQADISEEQLEEIARGLEDSEADFLWVIRKGGDIVRGLGFEERVKGRGMVVGEWVDQREILGHPAVGGFLSHCGWNSVMESVCVGVPMLAWPMMAEQPLNARMVAEEVKVGIRVEGSGMKGFVRRGAVVEAVRELMAGEKGEEVRRNAKEYAVKAMQAMEEGSGSSWKTLNLLIHELCDDKAR